MPRGCSTLWEKPLMSTLLRASSHMSQELSFHTWVAMLYSSISGSCTGQVPSGGGTGPATRPSHGLAMRHAALHQQRAAPAPRPALSGWSSCPRTPAHQAAAMC